MNRTDNSKSQNRAVDGNGALEVGEPAVLYYGGGGGSAVADPDDADFDGDWDGEDDFGAPESLTVNTYEELCQKLAEGRADVEAGRVISLDDAVDEILRDIENGTI